MNSPAFQVYVNDFLGSAKVGMMTTEEIGAYWLLLCLDWQESGFVFEEGPLSRWCRLPLGRFRRAWKAIKPCFVERSGRMYNPRLEKEREKQAEWREKSSQGGRTSAEKRWGKKGKGGGKGGYDMVVTKGQPNGNTPLPLPVTTTTSTKSGGWVGRFLTAYTEATQGSYSAGRLGRELKDLIRDNGENPAFIAWTAFLASPDRRFGPPYFAKNYVDYSAPKKNGTHPGESPADYQARKRGYI